MYQQSEDFIYMVLSATAAQPLLAIFGTELLSELVSEILSMSSELRYNIASIWTYGMSHTCSIQDESSRFLQHPTAELLSIVQS